MNFIFWLDAMANLLDDLWQNGEPNWAAALSDPIVKLHLYGKAEPKARPQNGTHYRNGRDGDRC